MFIVTRQKLIFKNFEEPLKISWRNICWTPRNRGEDEQGQYFFLEQQTFALMQYGQVFAPNLAFRQVFMDRWAQNIRRATSGKDIKSTFHSQSGGTICKCEGPEPRSAGP